ncbi:MAG: hypothetical protein ABJL99_15100 [Aliishimia sp.]
MKFIPYNYSRELDIAKEALRQTEIRLEDMNGIASSADRRAMALASFYAALATFLATFAANFAIIWVVYACSVGFAVSAALAIKSCMPRNFHVRGHYWHEWVGHISDCESYFDAIKSQAKENDDRIDKNDATLKSSGENVILSYKCAGLSFLVLIISQILVATSN